MQHWVSDMDSDLSPEQQAFVRKLSDEMLARKLAENAVKITDSKEIDSLYFECASWSDAKPYYQNLGQFCGGIITERFIHPFSNGKRHVQFTFWVDENGKDVTECIEWTPYLNYPYPL